MLCTAEGSASGLQLHPSSDQLSSLFLPSFSLSQQQDTRQQPPPQQPQPQASSAAAQQPVVGLWDQQGSPQMSDTFGPLDSHPQQSSRKRASESNAFSASIEATAAKRGEAAGAQPDQQGASHQRPCLQDTDALLLDGQLGLLENDWQLAKSLNAMSVEDGTHQKGATPGQPRRGQPSGRGTLQTNPDDSTGQQHQREGVRRLALSGLDLPLPSMTAQQLQAGQHQTGVPPTFRPPAVAGGGCTSCLPTHPFLLRTKLQATSCGNCVAALDS